MQLELFDDQLVLFPDFSPGKREPANREAPASDAQVCLPFLSDIEYLSRQRGFCYASNRHFRDSTLSAMFGRSPRTIQRNLKALAGAEAIRIELFGPFRHIFVTIRGMMMLEEAGFIKADDASEQNSTTTRKEDITTTVSCKTGKKSRLPRQDVALPRQSDAHITISQSISVHQEEPRAENAKGDVAVKVEEPLPKNLRETFEQQERALYGRTFAEIVAEDLLRFDAEKNAKQQAANRSLTDDERAELNSWLRGFACAA